MADDLLSLSSRRRLFEVIDATPGLSAREVQRASGMAWGETTYHLERLEGAGLIHRERSSHQDFFFVAAVPLGERTLLKMGRSAAVRKILVVLLEDADLTLQEIADRTGLSLSRSSIHLRRLLGAGLLRSGRRGSLRTFVVGDPDRTARVLVAYRSGYSDAWVDRLIDSWAELFPP
jgi:predicted transcriptional regulator